MDEDDLGERIQQALDAIDETTFPEGKRADLNELQAGWAINRDSTDERRVVMKLEMLGPVSTDPAEAIAGFAVAIQALLAKLSVGLLADEPKARQALLARVSENVVPFTHPGVATVQ